MMHKYVGDVGDFGKYGLLRALCGDDIRLGIVWCLTDASESNNDGKHDSYLCGERNRKRFRECDPDLFDAMKRIRANAKLNVQQIVDESVLPDEAIFYSSRLQDYAGPAPPKKQREQRWAERSEWLANAMEKTRAAKLVFLDPDNGIRFSSKQERSGQRPSHKHVYWDEIEQIREDADKSVVVYHHLCRHGGDHITQIQTLLKEVCDRTGVEAWGMHFRRGNARVFAVIPCANARYRLNKRSDAFAQRWKEHAKLVPLQ
jgi:hypothetical protein